MAAWTSYTTIPYINPLIVDIRFKTLISAFNDEGEEKRRRKWLYPKRDITLSYQYLSRANARILWSFYVARHGSWDAFNFFLNYLDTYEGEYIGTGDGSTVLFNLPSKNASSYTIYVNQVVQTVDVDYVFGTGTGADGADKVTFTTGPGRGYYISYDFTGVMKVRCRFMEDTMSLEQMWNKFIGIGVTLRGILNE